MLEAYQHRAACVFHPRFCVYHTHSRHNTEWGLVRAFLSSSSLLIFVLDEQVDGEDAKVVRPNEDQQLLDLRPRHGALPLRLVPLDEPDRGQLLEGEEAEADEMEGEGWRENEKSEGRRVV